MNSPLQEVHAPLLSIGMPVFNGAQYLAETIESILTQHSDLEVIISDNASTDETEVICRAFAARDRRIQYHRYTENRGAAWNYNNCFRLARGKFFKWAAYDDKLAPNFSSRCLDVLEGSSDIVLAYAAASVIDEAGDFLRYDSDKMDLTDERPSERFKKFLNAYRGHNICNPVFGIFRRDVLARTRLIGNFLSSDQILIGETALNGKIREIPDGLFFFRWHPKNSMCGYSCAERMLWFDPMNKSKLSLVHCQWFQNYSDSISKAPMSAEERRRCRRLLYGWALEHGVALSKEMTKAILWPILRRTIYRSRATGQ
jgi:glycosyltransferase involved in cell wall biosynthesis